MKKTMFEIYALSVCFASLIPILISAVLLVNAMLGVCCPTLKMNSDVYNELSSNDLFWNDYLRKKCMKDYSDIHYNGEALMKFCHSQRIKPNNSELDLKRREALAYEEAIQRRSSQQDLLQALIILLLSTLIFGLHWRLLRER